MSIPKRSEVNPAHCWNLGSLFENEVAWEKALVELKESIAKLGAYKGRLHEGSAVVLEYLQLSNKIGILDERVANYAYLRAAEDGGDSKRQEMKTRYIQVAVALSTETSWFQPELLSLDAALLESYLNAKELAEFRIVLDKIIRYKPHTLSASEERILAMQQETTQTATRTFDMLVDVDFNFGEIDTPEGPKPLSHSSFMAFMQHPDRSLRERAWKQYYAVFEQHKNTLSSLLLGSIQTDVFRAKVRGYPSAIEAALFPDKVDIKVYDQLTSTVREFLPDLHAYYELRRKKLGVDKLAIWDTRVSMVQQVKSKINYEEAVELVANATAILGDEYTTTLRNGLLGGWVDRYENQGKDSGAFSSGVYTGQPYILMNYKDEVLRDLFTLAHEAGHSMHSWYSVRNQPFQHYSYTIFEAEVASTFNEQLLFYHMIGKKPEPAMLAYLYNKQIDDTIATIFRQTMFAEFERLTHKEYEENGSLSVERIRAIYNELLRAYFGPQVELPEALELECLRIPHFYRAFYVYKYATGLSAATALCRAVREQRPGARDKYLGFLKSGGSRYPIESLREAGVDMASPQPIRDALEGFRKLVKEFSAIQF